MQIGRSDHRTVDHTYCGGSNFHIPVCLSREIWEEEGGDALMPMLHALREHRVLESIRESPLLDEPLFACLNDLNVVCCPERVGPIYKLVEDALEHA